MLTRIQKVRALVLLAIYSIALPYFILRSPPSRESLTEVDVTASSMDLHGKNTGPWTLVITDGESQFRRAGLGAAAVATVKEALRAPGERITALVGRNLLYLEQYFGGRSGDYEVFELTVGRTVIIPYADSLRRMRDLRTQAIVVLSITCIVAGGAWVWRGRKRPIPSVEPQNA